jgi:hypothetical protein
MKFAKEKKEHYKLLNVNKALFKLKVAAIKLQGFNQNLKQ